MKTKHLGMITTVTAMLFLLSCKKTSLETTTEKNNMAVVSSILAGNLLSGNVAVKSNEDEIEIDYNDGDKYILISKIPHSQTLNIDNLKCARIITSKYGIVINDLDNNKVYFLENNDSESAGKFKIVQSRFTNSFRSDKIFGTTIVNTEKS